MADETYLIAGLGNPGPRYQQNRHNVGFMFLDWFADQHNHNFSVSRWKAEIARLSWQRRSVILCKPMSFMNQSGGPVAGVCRYFSIAPNRVLVVHDDIDMKFGRIKLTHGGGAGGHNGIRSIAQQLGDTEFFRLKIGIGRPGDDHSDPRMAVESFVLTDFSGEQRQFLDERFEQLSKGLGFFIDGDLGRARTLLNSLKQ
jgi:PTH1 family peptidyl-tRNA hydrolase